MRTRVYFVRHGEAQSNVDPLFKQEALLTEKGMEQAQALALHLKNIPIEIIYTSKILRALSTAREIEKTTKKKVVILEFLKERKGVYVSSADYSHTESFDSLKLRLKEAKIFFENLCEKHVMVVSHAIFLKALAGYIVFGESFTEELLNRIDVTLMIDHASVSKFVFSKEKNKWHMEFWNDKAYLNERI